MQCDLLLWLATIQGSSLLHLCVQVCCLYENNVLRILEVSVLVTVLQLWCFEMLEADFLPWVVSLLFLRIQVGEGLMLFFFNLIFVLL